MFPNLSYLHVMIPGSVATAPVPFLAFKLWEPTSLTTTRVHSFFVIDKCAPAELITASKQTYIHTFG